MRSFSQGCGPKDAQEQSRADTTGKTINALQVLAERNAVYEWVSVSRFIEQLPDMGHVLSFAIDVEPIMDIPDSAVSTDQDGGRHVLQVVLLRDVASRVVDNLEFDKFVAKELLSEISIVVDVYGHDDETLPAIGPLDVIHPGKGLQTGRAPGRPEIEMSNFSLYSLRSKVRDGCISAALATGSAAMLKAANFMA